MASPASGSAKKILQNSFWYGLETLLETVIFLGTSIVVARALGPDKLGYFGYINLFVGVASGTGGTGLAMATRRYMSEFIALEQLGLARAVYRFTYKYQLLASIVLSSLGLAGVWLFGEPHFRLMASILILSIVPAMMSWVPAQANISFEDLSKNTFSALGYLSSYTVVIVLTLYFHWDLVGIASASLVGRTFEAVLRTFPLHTKLRMLPLETLPQETVSRIRKFCIEAMGIQIVTAIVWGRSELIFLRHYSTLKQMGFYTASTGLASKLMLVPRTFGGATGVSLMVESTRDPKRVNSIVRNASRFLLLVAIPVHFGAAAIASQAVQVGYGSRYLGAIPVFIVVSILSIPLAFQEIPDTLMRASDRQKQIFFWLIVTGVLNMALDWALIPRFAAVGAAWGNGLAQAFGMCALWMSAKQAYTFSLPKVTALRLLLAGSIMAAVAFLTVRLIHGVPGLVAAIVGAVPLYIVLVKLFHGLQPSDGPRLSPIGARLPLPFRRAYYAAIAFVIPAV